MNSLRQISRQLDILRTLHFQRFGRTTGELAEEFEVSRRTIERDLQSLLDANFPLYSERRSRNLYWRLTSDTWLPPLHFTPLEMAALIFIEGFSDALQGTPFRNDLHTVCQRLQTTLSPSTQDYLRRAAEIYTPHTRAQKSYIGFQAIIDTLNDAILKQCVCLVTYRTIDRDTPKTYRIEPLRLFYYHGGLYLISRVPAYNQLITQAVERIEDLQATEETFEIPVDLPLEDRLYHAFGIIYEEPFDIRVYFTPRQAPYIRERHWHPSQQIEEQEDGGIILSLHAGGFYEIKSWILSHGQDARVLEPKSLCQAIIDELRKSLVAYEKDA